MTKKISVNFRTYSSANKSKKILKACAKIYGDTQYSPRSISFFGLGELRNSDLKSWNQKKQRFTGKSEDNQHDNALLSSIQALCDDLMEQNEVDSINELWKLVEACKRPEKRNFIYKKTFETFLEALISEMRDEVTNKLPSSNYQVYVRLLHHLQRENKARFSFHIIETPIEEVSDKHFKQFGDYLKGLEGVNYLDNMRYFKRAHNIAVKKKLAPARLTYPFTDDAPPKTYEQLAKMTRPVACLTNEQISQLENLDLSLIDLHCKKQGFYKELYLDACLLIYYLYSRPIDILSMKVANIKQCVKGKYLEYLPAKKKNSVNAEKSFVRIPICKKAQAIIDKYRGMSRAGYLLPFSVNDYEWDLSVPEQYHKRYYRCNHVLDMINKFLKKVGNLLDIQFENDTFTTYVFRHTAISSAITDKKIPPLTVAKMAGTSIKEIERTYFDHTSQMFDYF